MESRCDSEVSNGIIPASSREQAKSIPTAATKSQGIGGVVFSTAGVGLRTSADARMAISCGVASASVLGAVRFFAMLSASVS